MTKRPRRQPVPAGPEQADPAGKLSRRTFLNAAGSVAAGGLVVAAGGGLFARREARAADTPEAPALPWKYAKLDPLEAGRRGYEGYLLKGG